MKIDSLAVGPIGTTCYILQDEKEKVCAIIDPGDEAERIEKTVKYRLHPRYDPADPWPF